MSDTVDSKNESEYKNLRLSSQLCFPIYACSRTIISDYRHLLRKLRLTYTQYVTMLVLWEHKSLSLREIGNYLFLDSGTLTSVLKQLERKKLIKRAPSEEDKRCIIFTVTDRGLRLRDRAVTIPREIAKDMNLTSKEAGELYVLLYKVLGGKTFDEAKKKRGY